MGRKLALIIGSSEYDDITLAQLATPCADVSALVDVLRDSNLGDFDEVRPLINQPTSVLLREIARLFARKKPDDLSLLYFSGHGVRNDEGNLYLAAKDTERDLLSATAIPASFITSEMDHSRSRRQVLILDCCHSGAFSRGTKGAAGSSVGTAAAFEGTGYGRVVLTASDSTQYAWEGDQVTGQAENSVFTHHLIQGIRTGEADIDADGRITLDELYDYVYGQVVNETSKQTPGKWAYKQHGEIIIARNPHPILKPVELPLELQKSIEDLRPWVREGTVNELGRLLNGTDKGMAVAAYKALKLLVNDDSRRISNAAKEALSENAEFLHAIVGIEAETERPVIEETERVTIEKAKTERPVLEKIETASAGVERTATQSITKRPSSYPRPSTLPEEDLFLKAGRTRPDRLPEE